MTNFSKITKTIYNAFSLSMLIEITLHSNSFSSIIDNEMVNNEGMNKIKAMNIIKKKK